MAFLPQISIAVQREGKYHTIGGGLGNRGWLKPSKVHDKCIIYMDISSVQEYILCIISGSLTKALIIIAYTCKNNEIWPKLPEREVNYPSLNAVGGLLILSMILVPCPTCSDKLIPEWIVAFSFALVLWGSAIVKRCVLQHDLNLVKVGFFKLPFDDERIYNNAGLSCGTECSENIYIVHHSSI